MKDEGKPQEGTKPSKDQIAENVKVSDLWLTAIKRGHFQGEDAVAIATLTDFLGQQNVIAKRALDLALEADANAAGLPDWAKPETPNVDPKHLHPEEMVVNGCEACIADKADEADKQPAAVS